MKVFYHNDPDGKVSAYIVNKDATRTDNYNEEYIPMEIIQRKLI